MARRARGRHRRPANRTRSLGLATAPLIAAIPMATTASAKAATTDTWERLASCESGGRWHINTGNGFYGGLQFSQSTWRSTGGARYAARADLASKAEQLTVGERLLDQRGWAPWPACRDRLGLDAADRQGSPGNSGGATSAEDRARDNRSSQGRASRGKHRRSAGAAIYVVRRGDTLSAIARRKHVPGGWAGLYRINRETVGRNPALIRPGQRLRLR